MEIGPRDQFGRYGNVRELQGKIEIWGNVFAFRLNIYMCVCVFLERALITNLGK